jgi:hypothetical protein
MKSNTAMVVAVVWRAGGGVHTRTVVQLQPAVAV